VSQSFNYEIELKVILDYTIENLNTYWLNWIERLEMQLPFIDLIDQDSATKQLDEAVEWSTLGMLRQLYTLKEHGVKSKVESGYYGLTIIPPQWHGLINEAIHIKRRLAKRNHQSNKIRMTELIALLRYIHKEANYVFEEYVVQAAQSKQ